MERTSIRLLLLITTHNTSQLKEVFDQPLGLFGFGQQMPAGAGHVDVIFEQAANPRVGDAYRDTDADINLRPEESHRFGYEKTL